MGISALGETGDDQEVAPVGLGQRDGVVQLVEPALAQFQGSAVDALVGFRRCVASARQVSGAIFSKEAADFCVLCRREQLNDVALDTGGEVCHRRSIACCGPQEKSHPGPVAAALQKRNGGPKTHMWPLTLIRLKSTLL